MFEVSFFQNVFHVLEFNFQIFKSYDYFIFEQRDRCICTILCLVSFRAFLEEFRKVFCTQVDLLFWSLNALNSNLVRSVKIQQPQHYVYFRFPFCHPRMYIINYKL